MADTIQTIYVLSSSDISVSDGGELSGHWQGDGHQLQGLTITLNAADWQAVNLVDDDEFYDDSDLNQKLAEDTTIGGVTAPAGAQVQAEYVITVQDSQGNTYKMIAFNMHQPDSPDPNYGTIEGLSFVGPPGAWPPVGEPLTVIATAEGPGYNGEPLQSYSGLVTPICFVTGTRIATPSGEIPVERLQPGDLVLTLDHGPQPLIWTGAARIGGTALALNPAFRPVQIAAGAIGPGLPARPLLVSRQHRLLVASGQADLHFGHPEVLVPAQALLGRPGIAPASPPGRWAYHHLLCARHEILLAEGLPVESLLPGAAALDALPHGLRRTLPRLPPAVPARPLLRSWEAPLCLPQGAGPRPRIVLN